MAVEPPVVSPATLAEAYALKAAGDYRPLAGGTDLMVQLEADVAEPPAAVLISGASMSCAVSAPMATMSRSAL